MRNPSLNSIASAAIFLFCLSYSIPTTSSTNNNDHLFLRCLNKNSHPDIPISAVTYTPAANLTSYSSVLQSYIRNLRFNQSTTPKPRVIVTASHVSHVQAAVVCGRNHTGGGLHMRIRSGGHDFEGLSYISQYHHRDPFFVLDMFNLRAIEINMEDETAWIQVGATLGELYYRIAEKSSVHGFPAGVCPTIGVGGHFSGGGYGNMIRKYGLSVDNIIDAEVVDVNGRLLNRETMGEDLFWAITGGGGASFGVVIAYKIKLVPVPAKVTVFLIERTYDHYYSNNNNAVDIAHRWQQIALILHEDLFIRMIFDVLNTSIVRTTYQGMFLGDSTRLVSVMNQTFPELGLYLETGKNFREMSWVESTLFSTGFPLGSPLEALLNRVPQSIFYQKNKSDYLNKPMSKAGIKALFKKLLQIQISTIQFNPYGGRMNEIPASEKPFPHRGSLIKLLYLTEWENIDNKHSHSYYINLSRSLHAFMTPYATKSPREAFINSRDLDLGMNQQNTYAEGKVYGLKYFKGNFKRLVKIKTKVDPHNFFRNEQSIPVFPSQRKQREPWK